ncbi:MAG: cysteine peptidase family C39 domain-containing protein [Marinilabiliales bacterium]|nr:cysteine peptidase family C39 domain-containing protein [Marinilabiliales bacterium]
MIRYFGGNSGIDQVRRLSGTTQSGTSMLGLYQAALGCGMEATGYEASIKDIIAFAGVLILHVTPEKDMNIILSATGIQVTDSLYGIPHQVSP